MASAGSDALVKRLCTGNIFDLKKDTNVVLGALTILGQSRPAVEGKLGTLLQISSDDDFWVPKIKDLHLAEYIIGRAVISKCRTVDQLHSMYERHFHNASVNVRALIDEYHDPVLMIIGAHVGERGFVESVVLRASQEKEVNSLVFFCQQLGSVVDFHLALKVLQDARETSDEAKVICMQDHIGKFFPEHEHMGMARPLFYPKPY